MHTHRRYWYRTLVWPGRLSGFLWVCARAMPVGCRVLLVLCALPPDEVSCRFEGHQTLYMVAKCGSRLTIGLLAQPSMSSRQLDRFTEIWLVGVPAKSTKFALSRLAMQQQQITSDASCRVCDAAMFASGPCRTASECNFIPLGGGARLIGIADGQLEADNLHVEVALQFHAGSQFQAFKIGDVPTSYGARESARNGLSAHGVLGSTTDDAASILKWVRFRILSASSLRGGRRDTEQAHSQRVSANASYIRSQAHGKWARDTEQAHSHSVSATASIQSSQAHGKCAMASIDSSQVHLKGTTASI